MRRWAAISPDGGGGGPSDGDGSGPSNGDRPSGGDGAPGGDGASGGDRPSGGDGAPGGDAGPTPDGGDAGPTPDGGEAPAAGGGDGPDGSRPGNGDGGSDGGDADPGDDGGAVAEALSGAAPTADDVGDRPWIRRYVEDARVHAGVVLALAVYPFVYAGATSVLPAEATTLLPGIDVLVTVLYFGLFAMSFDFISGYTGYLSFGHAAFYGVGAYFVVLTANGKTPFLGPQTPFLVLLVVAGLLAAVLAVLIGAVSFRLSGVYFAMITLGFSQVIFVLMSNWDYVGQNPSSGASVSSSVHPEGFRIGVPFVDALSLQIGRLTGDSLALGPVQLSGTEVSFYLIGAVVLVCYLAMQRVIHSPFGRVMIAIRENEERARAVGYDTLKYKLGAFAVSAFFAAVAGGLFAGYRRSVAPDNSLFFLVAGNALLAAIIGGFGTLAGPFFGWLFHETLREFLSKGVSEGHPDGLLPYLRELLGDAALATRVGGVEVATLLDALFNGRASLYIGLLFVAFVLYVPAGLLGTVRAAVGGTLAKRLPGHLRAWVADRFG